MIESDPLKEIENLTQEVHALAEEHGKHVFQKYPLTFGLLVAFGGAALLNGLKGMVEQIQFLNENPFYVFLGGAAILLFTGTLYKKLSK